MSYDKESIPPMFFSPEIGEMVTKIQSYHETHTDANGVVRYAIPSQSELMTYYNHAGAFRIVLETETGLTLPDVTDIELLTSRIETVVQDT